MRLLASLLLVLAFRSCAAAQHSEFNFLDGASSSAPVVISVTQSIRLQSRANTSREALWRRSQRLPTWIWRSRQEMCGFTWLRLSARFVRLQRVRSPLKSRLKLRPIQPLQPFKLLPS